MTLRYAREVFHACVSIALIRTLYISDTLKSPLIMVRVTQKMSPNSNCLNTDGHNGEMWGG